MQGKVKIASDDVEIVASGSFIPFNRKNLKQILDFQYEGFEISIHILFRNLKNEKKDNQKEVKRFYSPEWINRTDGNTELKLTFYNTPMLAEPGGPIEPIKLGIFEAKTLYLRIRTFGSSAENMVVFYSFYIEDGVSADE